MDGETELTDDMFLVTADDGGAPTLSFSRSPTVLLSFAANRFTRSAGRVYQRKFGLGAMDWRMLVMLTREPGCNAAHASKTIGIDKGAVSRSLARLEKQGLATATDTSERRRRWRLTEKGRELHGKILAVALARQSELLNGFSAEDVRQFNAYLLKFLENLENTALD